MLVLSRKTKQSIVLSGNITIEVLEVRRRSVKIGITAPDQVSIVRAEVSRVPELAHQQLAVSGPGLTGPEP